MACHYITLKNETEFLLMMKERNPDLIMKMVKCVLSAAKRNKPSIDIFDITFKDTSSMVFSIDRAEYKSMFKNCLDDLIKLEEYELCAEVTKQINRRERIKITEEII